MIHRIVFYEKNLSNRNYNQKKIQENVEAEIMQVILDDCNEYYPKNKIKCCNSNTIEEMEKNLGNIKDWIKNFVNVQKPKNKIKHENDKNLTKFNDKTFFEESLKNDL